MIRHILRSIGRNPLVWVGLAASSFAIVTTFMPIDETQQPHPAPPQATQAPLREDSVRADVAAGECWGNDGKQHGYPTRLWMLVTDETGSRYVDTSVQTTVDAAIEGRLSDMLDTPGAHYEVAAYCDAIILP